MGGSTYGRNGGYAVAQITSDRVRVAYHYQDDPREAESNAPGWRPVLDKPLAAQPAPRTLTITAPPPGVTVTDERLRVEVATAGPAAEYRDWSVTLNGRPIGAEPAVSGRNAAFELSLDPLDAGRAWTTIRATAPDGTRDVRTVAFHVGSDVATGPALAGATPNRLQGGAPTVLGDAVVLAGTDGRVVALDRATGETRWTFTTGGEILGTPAVRGDLLILGSGDGSLYALDGGGRLRWMQDLGAAIYAPPTLSEDVVFVGDLTGRLHARDVTNGRALWTFARADYGIEAAAVVWDDLVICGAWDGYLYAVDRATGELRWRTLGPKSSEGRGVRYYAPADCPPALLGDQLLVTDRGYVLAAYDRVGRQGNPVDLNIARSRRRDGRERPLRPCRKRSRGEVRRGWQQALGS
jgi:outer membrane protein assembly factor BamB